MNPRALLILKIVMILLLAAALPAEISLSRAWDQDFELKFILTGFTVFPLLLFAGAVVLLRVLSGLHAYYSEIWRGHPLEPPGTWFAVPFVQSIAAVICAVVTLCE